MTRRTAAVRIEARAHAILERHLRGRGWTPRLVPHTGYGGDGWARVLARVVLARPGSTRHEVADGRGWRRFVPPSAVDVPVTIELAGATHEVRSDRDGYVDVRLPAELEPGWATARLSVGGTDPVAAPLRIVGPETRLGLLSDIDDTVIVTMLPRPLVALRNAMLTRESDRRPVPGMAELYAEVVATHPDAFVVYLSTGAWNAAAALTAFLDRHGYPPGPLLLTDWGPTLDGWFRSGREHKRAQLRRLFDELPRLRWLLVGDDGQHDPSIYAEAAQAHPDRVLGVAIRQLSVTEQLATHGTPGAKEGGPFGERYLPGDPVCAPDGHELREALRARGLVLGPRAS